MNKQPLTKKQIINILISQKKIISQSETINLTKAKGRILADDLKSKINLPPFNNSAVDGYAILKNDLIKNKMLFCSKRIAAGDNKDIKIKNGEVIRIFTGAKMPLNSATIVMQENVIKKGNR